MFQCEVFTECTLADCKACPQYDSRAYQIEVTADGIGDHLLGLSVVMAWKRDNPGKELHYAVKPWLRGWVELFGGYDRLVEPGGTLPHAWRCNNDGRWHFVDGVAAIPNRLPPPVRELPADAVEWAEQYRGAVVLAPWTARSGREWGVQRWREVERLLMLRGIAPVVLGVWDAPAAEFVSPKALGQSPARVAALLRASRCLVGSESGMAHLAGALSVPAVVLSWMKDGPRVHDVWRRSKVIQKHAESITPEEVVRAVEVQASPRRERQVELTRRAEAEGFPAEEMRGVFTDRDRAQEDIEEWLARYAALWQAVRELAPRSIVEIGVRAGYSSWAMLRAVPGASLLAIDADVDPTKGNSHGGYLGAWSHAARINEGANWRLMLIDSHRLERLPPCDLCFIDGDHLFAGCTADLELAERSGCRWILCDDYATSDLEVRAAVDAFVSSRPHLSGRFIDNGSTGLYLIERS